MTARDAETPRDYTPDNESPRECCANLAMTFRFNANAHAIITPAEFQNWASRLEDACRKLDAQKSPDALLDCGGLTDRQLQRLGLAVGGLLAGGADRATALAEIRELRDEQTRVSR